MRLSELALNYDVGLAEELAVAGMKFENTAFLGGGCTGLFVKDSYQSYIIRKASEDPEAAAFEYISTFEGAERDFQYVLVRSAQSICHTLSKSDPTRALYFARALHNSELSVEAAAFEAYLIAKNDLRHFEGFLVQSEKLRSVFYHAPYNLTADLVLTHYRGDARVAQDLISKVKWAQVRTRCWVSLYESTPASRTEERSNLLRMALQEVDRQRDPQSKLDSLIMIGAGTTGWIHVSEPGFVDFP